MDDHIRLLHRIAQPGDGKIVLLVLDGVGDIRNADQPRTALEVAETPILDALATRSALGRIVPVAQGVTPGSGPGHLALFGYDPTTQEADIGRGALEALGVGVDFGPGDVVARGNFATIGADGKVADRRAGRISTEENRRIVGQMNRALAENPPGDIEASIHAGEGHRFVLLLRGDGLSPAIADTDPQEVGEPPRALEVEGVGGGRRGPLDGGAADAGPRHPVAGARRGGPGQRLPAPGLRHPAAPARPGRALRPEGRLLRRLPPLPGRGEAGGDGDGRVGKGVAEAVDGARRRWRDFDFLFLHVKATDKAGEDGDLDAKVRALEEVDAKLPELLGLMDPGGT